MFTKFSLGHVVSTPGALDALAEAEQTPHQFLTRHAQGDWGDVCAKDRRANDRALTDGTRLLSAYTTAKGVTLWLITEADRSATTFLLPEEY